MSDYLHDYVYERQVPRVVAQTATAMNAALQAQKSVREAQEAANAISDAAQQVKNEGDIQESRVREAGQGQVDTIVARGASVTSAINTKTVEAQMWAGQAQQAAEQASGLVLDVDGRISSVEDAVGDKQDALTTEQMAATNSTITEDKVSQYDEYSTLIFQKQDRMTEVTNAEILAIVNL